MLLLRVILAGLLCALGVSQALAYPASANTGYSFAFNSHPGPYTMPLAAGLYTSAAAACSATGQAALLERAGFGSNVYAEGGTMAITGSGANNAAQCTYVVSFQGNTYPGTLNIFRYQMSGYVCPNGGSLNGTTCVCPAGETDNGTSCLSNPCSSSAGQSHTMNVTSGWARSSTPNANDVVIDYHQTGEQVTAPLCDGQCISTFDGVDGCYRSQVPGANGLHRVSCDFKMTRTATQCGSASATADPNVPPPACPGYVGSVNGKAVCVDPLGGPATPSVPQLPGTPPEQPGNPSAGNAPSTGSGSGVGGVGRTPSTGNGGNNGGGSNASTPGGGSDGNGQTNEGGNGTGVQTVEVNTCGLPGQPACRIDETGTPNGNGAFNGAKGQFDSAAQAEQEGISGAGSRTTGLSWTYFISLPTGVCTPLDLSIGPREFIIDPCTSSGVALWRQILGWMLFVLTGLYMWRSATGAVGAGARS